MVRTDIGFAIGAIAGVKVVAITLKDALEKKRWNIVEKVVRAVESWQNDNEQERLAYELLMKNRRYKKLYEEAKRYIGLGSSTAVGV